MGQWLALGWYVDGMAWESYLRLSAYDRWVMNDELADLIPKGDDGDGAPLDTRPKRYRK